MVIEEHIDKYRLVILNPTLISKGVFRGYREEHRGGSCSY